MGYGVLYAHMQQSFMWLNTTQQFRVMLVQAQDPAVPEVVMSITVITKTLWA